MVDKTQKSILACYKLSDYPVQDWVTQIWNSTTNKDYRDLLSTCDPIKAILTHFRNEELKEYTIEDVHTVMRSEAAKHDFISLSLLLWTVYQRENAIGPSIFTEYVEDTRKPLVKGYLPETDLDCLSTKNEYLQNIILKNYEKDGEPFYQKSQLLPMLTFLDQALMREDLTEDEKAFKSLMQARLFYLKDLSLNSSVVHLKDSSLNLFQDYIALVRKQCDEGKTECQQPLVMLLAEVSYCQLHFYKYDLSEQSVNEALRLYNLQMELTGALGKRTIYQENDIAQLTLSIETRSV